ncbi:MAG: PP2C family protein-serine/threonine phosphatase [Calditrichaeota bacterium]|nr:PP2C family protein-serine/threonine phosphatase [Calditrichota bacterium]
MKFRNQVAIYILLILVSAGILWHLYPKIHPFGNLNLPLTKSEIEAQAVNLAREQQLNIDGFYADAVLNRYTQLLRQTQMELGLEKANTALNNDLPVYFWQVRWLKDELLSNRLFSNGNDQSNKMMNGAIFKYDTKGRLLEYTLEWPDTSNLADISQSDAESILAQFISEHTPFFYSKTDTIKQQRNTNKITEKVHQERVDYDFFWKTTAPLINIPIELTATVVGDRIIRFQSNYQPAGIYQTSFVNTLDDYLFPLMLMLIVISTIIIALRRWQAYEMDFRFGIGLGIVAGLFFGIYLYFNLYRTMGINVYIPVILNSLFTGGSIVFIWAVGESIGRETWKEKFISLDLLRNGYVLHSQIGINILRGISIGILSLAAWALLVKMVSFFEAVAIIPNFNGSLMIFSSVNPLLRMIGIVSFAMIWTVTCYLLFGMSVFRRLFQSPWVVIGIVTLLITLVHRDGLEPYLPGVIIEAIVMAFTLWAFWQYDLIAGFAALVTNTFWYQAIGLFFTGNDHFAFSGMLLAGVFILIIGYALTTLFTRDRITDFDRLAPKFYKNITERQRLQKELEIAREVQMSFLPERNPQINELDIASRCIPALEIGGDYYDFVDLGQNRLGVVIGDVSGKGTQAAFYMTLTKGFLRALANMSESPAFVLSQLNRLFYQNVRRGVFISMIYGIFDLEAQELVLARAGHNPVLMRQTSDQTLQNINPRGLALGMEKGDAFERLIQEVHIPFKPNDVFVFYTDGFTEAMNQHKEEFGEHRFEAAFTKGLNGSAEDLMNGIFNDVHQFVGKTPQSDDMTIIVIKVRADGQGLTLGNLGRELLNPIAYRSSSDNIS